MPSDFPELTDPEGRLERRGAWETLFVPMDFWLDGARLWWGYEGPLPADLAATTDILQRIGGK